MAFDITRLDVHTDSIGGGALRIHSYFTGDAHSTIAAPGYFAGVRVKGVRAKDVIIVVYDSGDTGLFTVLSIAALTGTATVISASIGDEIVDPSDGLSLSNRLAILSRGAAPTLGTVVRKLVDGQNVVIDCWGDSITYGYDVVSSSTLPPINGQPAGVTRSVTPYPDQLLAALDAVYPGHVTVNNKGNPGDTIGEVYARMLNDTATPDVALVMTGINDGATPGEITTVAVYKANVLAAVTRMILRGTLPIILLPTPLQNYEHNSRIQAHAMAARQIAEEYDIPFVDTATQLKTIDGFKWTDTIHLTADAYAELGWHLAALFIPTGGDGGPKRVRAGDVLWAEDFFGPSLTYQVLSGPRSGYVAKIEGDTAVSQLAFYCEEDVIPVINTFSPTPGTTRSLEVTYRGFALGARTLTFGHAGDATFPRKRWQGPRLGKGYRVLTLSTPNSIPVYIENIEFRPASGGFLIAGQGNYRSLAVPAAAFPAALSGAMAAVDYAERMRPPFRLVANMTLPGNLGTSAGLMIAGDKAQTAGGYHTGTRLEVMRISNTSLVIRKYVSDVIAFTTTVASVFTTNTDWTGVLEIEVTAAGTLVFKDGVQVGSTQAALGFGEFYGGAIVYDAPSRFVVNSMMFRD